jgi:hypothetical protein
VSRPRRLVRALAGSLRVVFGPFVSRTIDLV